MKIPFIFCLISLCLFVSNSQEDGPPNIIFVIADDLGWSDVGFRNPRVQTPVIDQLAREGVVLDQSYVHPVCSPTRAAILSGMYPQNIGLQNLVIMSTMPHYMSSDLYILPEALKDLGYSTHMVGKWHLGYCKWDVTPLEQGFDTFFGGYNWGGDQFNHTSYAAMPFDGIDLSDQGVGTAEYEGIHSTDLFSDRAVEVIRDHDQESPMFLYLSYKANHQPVQVPDEYLPIYDDIEDEDRKIYLAMTTHMDEGIGRVIEALEETGMDQNTLVVFISDNGGDDQFGGSNYPLRGRKGTVWEGGTRSNTIVWGDVLRKKEYVNTGLFHATDWYPTLVKLAGGDVDNWEKDGVDQSALLLDGEDSQRTEMIYHINELRVPFQGVIRDGPYKFILGVTRFRNPGDDDWMVPPEIGGESIFSDAVITRQKNNETCSFFPERWNRQLYNVEEDPEEREDLYEELPDVACRLEERLVYYVDNMEDAFFPVANATSAADPDNFGGFWTPGWC